MAVATHVPASTDVGSVQLANADVTQPVLGTSGSHTILSHGMKASDCEYLAPNTAREATALAKSYRGPASSLPKPSPLSKRQLLGIDVFHFEEGYAAGRSLTENVKDERPRHLTSLKPDGSADTDADTVTDTDADRLRVTETDVDGERDVVTDTDFVADRVTVPEDDRVSVDVRVWVEELVSVDVSVMVAELVAVAVSVDVTENVGVLVIV